MEKNPPFGFVGRRTLLGGLYRNCIVPMRRLKTYSKMRMRYVKSSLDVRRV